MEQGNLVPDDVLLELVRERIEAPDCARGFVLDGFPRTIAQAQGLERMPGGDPRALAGVRLRGAARRADAAAVRAAAGARAARPRTTC